MSEPSPNQQRPQPRRRWPLWLGLGFFGAVIVALAISFANLWRQDTTPSTAQESGALDAENSGAAAVAESPGAAPPADLREHQQLVSAVVKDLGKEALIGDSPTRGNPEAEIILLEFSDFQCPFCAGATTEVERFMSDNEDKVLFVYKHLPLASIHPEALPAALASWAAEQQGQFWAFHDALFANQAALSDEFYVATAEALGLDITQFNRDRASEAAEAAVARDLALASELQLRSTPTFLMDELLIPGAVPADFFAEALARLEAFRAQNAES